MSNITEKMVENQILTYLAVKGILAWKNQSTGVFDPTKKVFRKSTNVHHISGVADILGIYDGRFLAIEVKRPYISKKTMTVSYRTQEQLAKLASREQVNFIERVKNKGGIAFFADSIEIVEDQLLLSQPSYRPFDPVINLD